MDLDLFLTTRNLVLTLSGIKRLLIHLQKNNVNNWLVFKDISKKISKNCTNHELKLFFHMK
jgi:hypothetical protein